MNRQKAYVALKARDSDAAQKAKAKLSELDACAKEWKAQRSMPFSYRGRSFDMIAGSIVLSGVLHTELSKCILEQVDVSAKLAELDALEDAFNTLAKLETAFYGPLQQNERDGVKRAQRVPGTGWRYEQDAEVSVGGVTYNRIADTLWITIGEGKRIKQKPVTGEDRSYALYCVLKRDLLKGPLHTTKEPVLARADALAEHLARNEGEWPKEY